MKKRLWFKAKNYGWGWYPCSWEGWFVTSIYIGYVITQGQATQKMFDTTTSFVFRYSFDLFFATAILIGICFLTGEKPEWRWGKKKK